MGSLLTTLGIALGAFAATNVDNLLALGAQMAASPPERHRPAPGPLGVAVEGGVER